MRTPKIKTVSSCDQGDTVFIFIKPFYYDDISQSLGIDTSDAIRDLGKLNASLSKSGQAFEKYGNTVQKAIENAAGVVSHYINTTKLAFSGGQKLTVKETIDVKNPENSTLVRTLETAHRKLQNISDEAKEAASNLAKLAIGDRYKPKVSAPTDILRATVPAKSIRLSPVIDVSKVRSAEAVFQREVDNLLSSGVITKEKLDQIFRNIGKGYFEKIPVEVEKAVSAFARLQKVMSNLGANEGVSRAQRAQLREANRSVDIINRSFRKPYEERHQQAFNAQFSIKDPFQRNDVTRNTKKEVDNYTEAIEKARKGIKGLSVTRTDVKELLPLAQAKLPNIFSGDRAKLYDLLVNIQKQLDNVGSSAEKAGFKIRTTLDNIQQTRNVSNIFKYLVGPVPTNVSASIEASLSKSFDKVGDEARKAGAKISDIQSISSLVSNGVISDWTRVDPQFINLARAIEASYQKLEKLNVAQRNQVQRPTDVPLAREHVKGFAPLHLDIATDQEKTRLNRDVESVIGTFSRLNSISLDRFKKLVLDAFSDVDNNLKGAERKLYDRIQRMVASQRNIGSTSRAKAELNVDLTANEKRVRDIQRKVLGPLKIDPIIGETKSIDYQLREKRSLRGLTQEVTQQKLSPDQIEAIFQAAKKGVDELYKLDFVTQGIGVHATDLIQIYNRVGDSIVAATNRANQQITKSQAANKTIAEQARTIQQRPQYYKTVTEGAPGIDPLITQLRGKRSGGALPLHATTGDISRVSREIANISTILARGEASLQDYSAAIDIVKNKRIVEPHTVEDVNRLRASVSNVANQIDIAANRSNKFNTALISVANAARLFIVSELYTAYSNFRQAIDQAITDSNKLSIQIGQIKAITQDAVAPTEEWAQALREVSDASGKDLIEISAAAYDALSNQITRSKDDTKEFLTTATEFGRTVGATPTESVNLLSSAINAFGKSMGDAEELSAEFFATIDIGRIRAQDLQNIYGRAALAGQRLGATTTEMNAALAVLTQNGLTTEDAITRLNNVFVKLFNPTKEMDKLFTKFGVTSAQQFVSINGFAGAIQRIEEAVRNGDAAMEELFPEIRTFAGYLGLTGQNAVKFSDAIKEIGSSADKFRRAIKLTTDEPVGQRLAVELQKIKNLFTVDYAQQFTAALAHLNDVIGGVSGKLKIVIDTMLTVGTAVTPVVAVTAAWAALSTTISLSKKAYLAFLLPIVSNPIGLFLLAAATAFIVIYTQLQRASQAAKQFAEDMGKLKEKEYKTSEIKVNTDAAIARVKAYSDYITKEVSRAWSQAAANSTIVFTHAINQQKRELDGLTERLKSAFSDVSNIVGKSISAVQNFPREASAIQRKLPRENIKYQEDTQIRYLESVLGAQKSYDQGIEGPTGSQVAIYDRIVQEMIRESNRLQAEANSVVNKTLDPSEIKSAHDAYVQSIDQAIQKYEQLRDEIISTGAQAGKSWATVRAQLEAIITPRIKPLNELRLQATIDLNTSFDKAKKDIAKFQEPLYELKGQIEEAEKKILEFDPNNLKGKKPEEIQEQFFKPIDEQRNALFGKLKELRPIIERTGFGEGLDDALHNLDSLIKRVKSSRFDLSINILRQEDLNRFSRDFDNLKQNVNARIDEIIAKMKELDISISSTFGKIAKLGTQIKGPDLVPIGNKFSEIFNIKIPKAEVDLNAVIKHTDVIALNKQIDLIKERVQAPANSNAFIPNIEESVNNALAEIQRIRDYVPKEIFDSSSIKRTESQLLDLREQLDRITDNTDMRQQLSELAKSTQEEFKNYATGLRTNIPAALDVSDKEFKKWFDTRKSEWGELSKLLEEYVKKLEAAPQINRKKIDVSRYTEPTPREQLQQAADEYQKQKEQVEEGKEAVIPVAAATIPQIVPGVPVPQIPTIPTPESAQTGVAIPTVPVQASAGNDALLKVLQSIDSKLGGTAPIPGIAPVPTQSRGGEINQYRRGGRVNKNRISYLQGGGFADDPRLAGYRPTSPGSSYNQLSLPVDPITGTLDLSKLNLDYGLQQGGRVRYFARGGLARGTDTIPSMLSNGEYVVPEKQTKKYHHVLEKIRKDTYYQEGGIVESNIYESNIKRVMNEFDTTRQDAIERIKTGETDPSLPHSQIIDTTQRSSKPPDTIYKNALNPLDFYSRHDAYSRWFVSKNRDSNVNMDQFVEGYNKGLYRPLPEESSRRQSYVSTQASTYAAVPALLRNQQRISPLNTVTPHRNISTRVSPNVPNAPNVPNRNIPNISNIIPNIPIKNVNLYNKVKTLKTLFPGTSLANIYRIATSYKAEGGFADDPRLAGYRPTSPGLNYNPLRIPVDQMTGIIDLSKLNLNYGFQRGGEATQRSYNDLYSFFEKNPEIAKTLLPVHDLEPRYSLVGNLIKRGYPEGVTTDASYRLYSGQNYKNIPHIQYDPDASKASYNSSQGIMTLPSKDSPLIAFDRLSVMRHEMEHVNQFPRPSFLGNVRSTFSDLFVDQKARESAAEIPPSIGDIAHTAELYRQHTHENANIQARIGNRYVNVDWMAKQARQHGFFKGRNATQLFATPSGKAYLKYLASEEKSRGGVVGIVRRYQGGGEVENTELIKTMVNNLTGHWSNRGTLKDTSRETNIIKDILSSRPTETTKLENILHSRIDSPRLETRIQASVEREGRKTTFNENKFRNPDYIRSSTLLLSNMYKGQIPNVNFVNSSEGSSYNPISNTMELGTNKSYTSLNPIGAFRHELEHATQRKAQVIPRNTPINNYRNVLSLNRAAKEIPASLGDIPFMAEVYKKAENKRLTSPVTVAPNINQSPDWMANQAREHGFFQGRTTTELLATPSGQSYLNRLLDATKQTNVVERSYNSINNDSINSDTEILELIKNKNIDRLKERFGLSNGGVVGKKVIGGYQDGGTIEEHVNRLSSQWNSNKNISLDSVSTESINKILLERPDKAYTVSDHLYEKSTPRKEIVRSARLLSSKNTLPASVSLLSQMWKGRSPNIRIDDSNISSKSTNSVSISNKSHDTVIDQISALSHELEHSKQIVKTIAPPRDSSEETKDTYSDIGSISKELPASVGDIAFTAKSYELTNKKPLDVPVRVSPYVTHNASWMAAQAEKQGYFQGRSMTELLSTPSGQVYTKRLLGYQEGGIVNDREKFSKLKASNKYDWNWNLISNRMQTESLHKVLETLYNFDDSRVNYQNYQEGGRVDERLIKNLTSYWQNIGRDTNKTHSLIDNTLQQIFSETPQTSFRLGEFLHDKEIPLGRLTGSFNQFSQTDIDKTSAKVLASMYRGKGPDIQYIPGGGEYLYKKNKITLESDRRNLHPYVSNLGILRHELEHSQQNAPYPSVSREQGFFTRINRAYAEVPATLGDIPFHAEVYKHLVREPLIKPVEVAPGVVHSPNFMANIAKQHGFFRGRTTTELLSTPSGQAYTRRLLQSTREYNNPQGTLNYQHLYDRNPQELKMLQLPQDKREEAIKKYYGLNTGGIVNYYDSGGMSNPPGGKKPVVGNMEETLNNILNNTSYYAKGGWTWFQPKGTDTIPAMLTPGEYVMPQKMTEKYLPILQKMREGRYEHIERRVLERNVHNYQNGGYINDHVKSLFDNSSNKNILTKQYLSSLQENEKTFSISEHMNKLLNADRTINNFQEGGMVNLPSTNKNMKYSTPNTISTSTDNSQTNHVNIHVNLNGDMKDENLGRKVGKQIQKEIRRGNLKLGK